MTWRDIDVDVAMLTAIFGGVIAGWLARGSPIRALVGFAATVAFSAAFIYFPRAISSFRLWHQIPQEVSLFQQILMNAGMAFFLTSIPAGAGCLAGIVLRQAFNAWKVRQQKAMGEDEGPSQG